MGGAPTTRWLFEVVLVGLPATSRGWLGPWSLRGTWDCWLHLSRLRGDSSSPSAAGRGESDGEHGAGGGSMPHVQQRHQHASGEASAAL